MGWLKDPEGVRRWWNRVIHARVEWWHYVILFFAFTAGYFFLELWQLTE